MPKLVALPIAGLLLAVLAPSRAMAQAPAAPLPTIISVDDLLQKPGGVRYLDAHWAPLPGPDGASYYDQYRRIDSVGLNWQLRRYAVAPPHQLVLEQFFTGQLPGMVLEGPSREFYPDGRVREELAYHKNAFAGTLRTFYRNGQVRRVQANGRGAGAAVCTDSLGNPLAKCPEYHTFAKLQGKNTYYGQFLKPVQQQTIKALPPGFRAPAGQAVVYYAFRIDPTGALRDARVLSSVAPEVARAVQQAIAQLPAFSPATYEGQPTDDVLEGFVRVPGP